MLYLELHTDFAGCLEPRSSPAPSRGSRRGGRAKRQPRGGTRSSRLQVEVESNRDAASEKGSANEEDGEEEDTEAGRDGSEDEGDGDSKVAESPAPRACLLYTSPSPRD